MILENYLTPRLRFRSLIPADEAALTTFFKDPMATIFFPNIDHPASYSAAWLKKQIRRYQSLGSGLCAVELRSTGELIGQCGLVYQFVDGIPKWEVGYHFFRPFWGHGYATEAAMACRDFCFEQEMAETLISIIHPDNEKSIAVAKRNGMHFWKDTVFKDHPAKVYRIRREDWTLLFEKG